jgi:hypothetical protein
VKYRHLYRLCARTIALIGVFAAAAEAVTTNWNTNSSGNFGTAANWNNGVPTNADTAVFNRGSAVTYNVSFPGSGIGQPSPVFTVDRAIVRANAVGARHTPPQVRLHADFHWHAAH